MEVGDIISSGTPAGSGAGGVWTGVRAPSRVPPRDRHPAGSLHILRHTSATLAALGRRNLEVLRNTLA